MAAAAFPVLPGFYNFLFLTFEPFMIVLPAFMIWVLPGAAWFHEGLVPSIGAVPYLDVLDDRTKMALWQLGNAYLVIGLLQPVIFRTVRDTLPNNPAAQERILRSSLIVSAATDMTHIIITILALSPAIRSNPLTWNASLHGNVSFGLLLFSTRVAWLLGIGRKTYSSKKAVNGIKRN